MKKRLFSLLLCIVLIAGILPMNVFAKGKTEINEVMVTGLVLNEGDQLFEVRSAHLSVPEDEKYELVKRFRADWKENGRAIDEAAQYHCESGKTYSIVINFKIKDEYADSFCFSDSTQGVPISVAKSNYSSSISMHFNKEPDYINIRFDITVPGSRKYPQIDTVRIQGPNESNLIEGSTPPRVISGDIKAYYSNFEIQSDKWVDTANPGTDAAKFISGKTYRYTLVLKAYSDYVFKSDVPVEFYCSGLMKEESKTLSYDKKTLTVCYTYKVQAAVTIDTLFLNATDDYYFYSPIEGKKVPQASSVNFFAEESEPFTEHTMLSGWIPKVEWHDKDDPSATSDTQFIKGKEYYFTVQYDIKDEYKHLFCFSDNTKAIIRGGKYNTVDYSVSMHSKTGGSTVTLRFSFVCQGKKELSRADVEISEPDEGEEIKSLYSDVYNIPLYCYAGVVWYENGVQLNPYSPGTFKAGANYAVEIYIIVYKKMQEAVKFPSTLKSATINGKKATVKPYNGTDNDGGVILRYNFGKLPYTVRDVSISVSAPQEGNTISYSAVSNGAGYSVKGSVGSDRPEYMQWLVSANGTSYNVMAQGSKFEAGKYYKLEMDVITSGSYQFAVDTSGISVEPNVSAAVNSHNAKVIKAYEQDPHKYITVIMDFGICNDSVIESIVIDGITEPIAGAYPEYSANVRGSGYHINTAKNSYYDDWQNNRKLYYIKNGVGWYDVTKNNWMYENETFIGGHIYKPMIYLVTDEGYGFYHDKDWNMMFTASINGVAATGNTSGSQGLVEQTISAAFSCEAQTVSYFEVYSLDVPQVGSTPDFTVLTAQPDLYVSDTSYGVKSSGVNWYDENSNRLGANDKFEAGKVYKVEIKIVPTKINDAAVSKFVNPVSATLNGYSLNEAGDAVSANNNVLTVWHTYSPLNNEVTHIHNYIFLKHNSDYHWYECSCGNKVEFEEHNMSNSTLPANYGNGSDGETFSACSVCGYESNHSEVYCPKTFTLSTSKYTYSGKAKKPSVTIKDKKGNTLKSGTDYTVKYSKNTDVGKASAKVTFKGKYMGTKTLSFTINPKGTSVSKISSPKKGQLKVTWKKQATKTTGYQIQYATNSKFTKGKKTVTVKGSKTTSKTIAKLSSKKKYYVRIRTYKTVSGKKYYSSWSKSKNLKTK
ncbi:MAG: fibronectin type III domain-containing protein [Eubacterium sp.]|nr:fibronectin type III domain-containing protein [Eubacterium sp.]